MLGAVLDGKENDPPQIALHVQEMLRRLDITLNRDGKAVTDPVELQQMLAQEVKSFLRRQAAAVEEAWGTLTII